MKAANDSTETQAGAATSAGSSANSTPSSTDFKTPTSPASLTSSSSKISFSGNNKETIQTSEANSEKNSCKQGALSLEKPEQTFDARRRKHSSNTGSADHSGAKCQKKSISLTLAASSNTPNELPQANMSANESFQTSLSASSGRRMTRSSSSLLEPALISPTSLSIAENTRKGSPVLSHRHSEGKISPRITRRMSLNKSKSVTALPRDSEGVNEFNIPSGRIIV